VLRTALKPTWIAGLLLALVVSGAFVLLGKWQMDNAASAPPPLTQTETPVALTEHFAPEQPMYGTQADQIVTMTGSYVEGTDVFIHPRLRDGTEGYWLVTAFRVDGAPHGEAIPVVRGWTASPEAADPAPAGALHITGRLLPAEGPHPQGMEQTGQGTVLDNLSSAELVNVWDLRSYAGYVVAFDVTASTGPAAGQEVGARAPGGELQTVEVGPQPQQTTYNWMNIFYAIEWVVFAGFAIYLWWRFLRDDHNRQRHEADLDRRWAEEWTATELERRRAAAREAKLRAIEDYERYHGVPAGRSASPAPSTSPQQSQENE
jgi:cytochrome oxidase assembly protein ShyY1